jgi:uncharacterized protein (TIGR02391 family)
MAVDSASSDGTPSTDVLAPVHRRLMELAAAHFMEDGAFPNLPDLERECARADDPLEYDATDPLPARFGFVSQGSPQEVRLNIAGLALTDVARPLLEDLVRLAQLEYETYIGPGDPRVTSDDLRERFGMTDEVLMRMGELVQNEPVLQSGFQRPEPRTPAEWSCDVGRDAIRLKKVRTVDDLVAVRPPTTSGVVGDASAGSGPGRLYGLPGYRGRSRALVDVDDLHPVIAEATTSLLTSGHPEQAVLDAAIAFQTYLRAQADLPETVDGTRLVEQAFARIVIPKEKYAKGQHEAVRNIALGMVGRYRNMAAHKRKELDHREASEAVGSFSLLCRCVDAATFSQRSSAASE